MNVYALSNKTYLILSIHVHCMYTHTVLLLFELHCFVLFNNEMCYKH